VGTRWEASGPRSAWKRLRGGDLGRKRLTTFDVALRKRPVRVPRSFLLLLLGSTARATVLDYLVDLLVDPRAKARSERGSGERIDLLSRERSVGSGVINVFINSVGSYPGSYAISE
jgi:hypothetical protein